MWVNSLSYSNFLNFCFSLEVNDQKNQITSEVNLQLNYSKHSVIFSDTEKSCSAHNYLLKFSKLHMGV